MSMFGTKKRGGSRVFLSWRHECVILCAAVMMRSSYGARIQERGGHYAVTAPFCCPFAVVFSLGYSVYISITPVLASTEWCSMQHDRPESCLRADETGGLLSSVRKGLRGHETLVSLSLLIVPNVICWLLLFPGYFQADHQESIARFLSGAPSLWHSMVWSLLALPLVYATPSYALYGLFQIALFVDAVLQELPLPVAAEEDHVLPPALFHQP